MNKEEMNVFWKKKNFCYFVLSLMVIAMHTLGTDFYSDKIHVNSVNKYIVDFFKIYLNSGAVPLFFIISAILFFRNVDDLNSSLKKVFKHVKSLITPFLIWNLIGIIFNLIIFNIPIISKYIEVRSGIDLNLKTLFEGLILYKYNLLYWYVAQLMIFTALSPIIFITLKNKKVSYLTFIVILLLYFLHIDLPFVIFRKDAFIYYYLGCIIGKYYFNLFNKQYDKKISYTALFAMLISIIANSILVNEYLWPILNTIIALSIWAILDLVKEVYKNEKFTFFDCSFFAYSGHYYIEPCISKVILIVLPMNILSMYVNNILTFIITSVLIYLVAVTLRKYASKIYSLLTGSR